VAKVMKMRKLALTIAVLGLLGAHPAAAGGMSAQELHQVATLRNISRVVIVDSATSDRWIYSRRAMTSHFPLSPLQLAIGGNARLMAAIRASAWSFDLKSVYSIYLGADGEVVIYIGEPPT
jgi:hypothetical protein